MLIPLAGYAGEPVSIRLDDDDTQPITQRRLETLLPRGSSGTKWLFKTKAPGLQKVQLRAFPSQPGLFQLAMKAKQWFTAAAANEPAAETRLTVTIGSQRFTSSVTKKRE